MALLLTCLHSILRVIIMITISLCMIVKNEEDVLGRALESPKDIADEIIIVDTGSSDGTWDIAKKYTDKVFNFTWIDDFSAARNFSFEKATKDYQMWLDADDIVPEESIERIKELKKTLDGAVDIVTMKYYTYFDENDRPVYCLTRERMIKRGKGYRWEDPVHECIPIIGNILRTDIEIWHRKLNRARESDRNLKIYEALERSGKAFTPRQLFYFARELKDHNHIEKAASYFEMFLAAESGWVEDRIAACYSLAICYKAIDKHEKLLPVLLKSFEYDSPRAEICSEIGYYYKATGEYGLAFRWFDTACGLQHFNSAGFLLLDYWGYIPNIEACVCLSHMGDYIRASIYNERAGEYKPENAAVLHNRAFLTMKMEETL